MIKRRVLIREKDWLTRLKRDAKDLYTRAEWVPLTKTDIEKENAWATLQGTHTPWHVDFSWHRAVIHRLSVPMYNDRYHQWRIWCDLDNQLWIRPSNANGVSSRLGIATLEKDA